MSTRSVVVQVAKTGRNIPMRKAFYLVAIAALAVPVLVTAKYRTIEAKADEKPALEVKIDNFAFAPQTLTVPAGSRVTWINKDDMPHSVVDKDQAFKSKALHTDEKFSYTFDKPGTYDYLCSIHPTMTGKIIVK